MLWKKSKRIKELEEDKDYLISKNERLERNNVVLKNKSKEEKKKLESDLK